MHLTWKYPNIAVVIYQDDDLFAKSVSHFVSTNGSFIETESMKYIGANTNVNFCKVINRKTVHLRIWERGTGETMACGTGACATVVQLVQKGKIIFIFGNRILITFDFTGWPSNILKKLKMFLYYFQRHECFRKFDQKCETIWN